MGNINLMAGAIMAHPKSGLDVANEKWAYIGRVCLVFFAGVILVLVSSGTCAGRSTTTDVDEEEEGMTAYLTSADDDTLDYDDVDDEGDEGDDDDLAVSTYDDLDDGTRGAVVYDPEDLSVLNVVLVHLTDAEPWFYDVIASYCPPEIRRGCDEPVVSGGAGDWGSGVITFTVDDTRPLQEAVFLLLEKFPLVLAYESAWACGCVGEPTPTGQLTVE